MLPTRVIMMSTAAAAILAGGIVAIPAAEASPHATLAKPAQVSIVDFAFMPLSRTVKVGRVVNWTWRGSYGHNVTISGPKAYHSITKDHGTYAVKFTKAGTYHVRCTIHAASMGMKMTIKVVN